MDREIKRKRSVPVKSNKGRYLTAEQRSVRNKVYDEYEKFEEPNARKWFEAVPYQLKYLGMIEQADQSKSNASETADQKIKDTERKSGRGV